MILSLVLTTLVPSAQAQGYPYTVQVDQYFGLVEVQKVVDMDGDGDLDIVTARYDDIVWWQNQGDGMDWVERAVGAQDASDLVVEDLDGDGDLDIYAAGYTGERVVYENVAAGALFTEHVLGDDGASAVGVGDVNGDGHLDLVSLDGYETTLYWHEGNGTIDGFGPGTFVATDYNMSGIVMLHDFDGDGADEIWVTAPTFGYEFFSIFTYAGGAFDEEERPITYWTDIPVSYAFEDLDGDGDDDMIVGTYSRIERWENLDGVAVLVEVLDDTPGLALGKRPTIGDVDLDGDLDFVVASSGEGGIELWENEGGSYDVQLIETDTGGNTRFADLVDLDCDGDLDFVMSRYVETVDVLINAVNTGDGCGSGPTDPTDPGDPSDPSDPSDPGDPGDPDGDGSGLEADADLELPSCSVAPGVAAWFVWVPLLSLLRRRSSK